MEIVGKPIQFQQPESIGAGEQIVGEHCRNRDCQSRAGHDQRFSHRSRRLIEGGLAAGSQGQQSMVDAPDRAEQADEGRGAADRSQHGQAILQRGAFRIERLPQGAGHQAVQVAGAG